MPNVPCKHCVRASRLPSVFTVNGSLCCICVLSPPLLSAAVHLRKPYASLFNVPTCLPPSRTSRGRRRPGTLAPPNFACSRAVSHTQAHAQHAKKRPVLLAVSLCLSDPFLFLFFFSALFLWRARQVSSNRIPDNDVTAWLGGMHA